MSFTSRFHSMLSRGVLALFPCVVIYVVSDLIWQMGKNIHICGISFAQRGNHLRALYSEEEGMRPEYGGGSELE